MKLMNKTIIYALVLTVILIVAGFYFFGDGGATVVYKTEKVDRGDVSAYVSATGTVNPIEKLEVGSRVSGTIKDVFVDYNSRVEKGDPLAEIDSEPFRAKLNQAQADLKKAQAETENARNVMSANQELYEKDLISKQEYENSRVKFSNASAALEQARAELEVAKTNLENTTVRSPISGVVITKNVSVGQAVASEGKPLFVVAEELSQMKVDTFVSEADIGKVEDGQEATFTVDAYPDRTFSGKVSQVRNEPTVNNNVVTYDVIVRVNNENLLLKPGMTAEVNILTDFKQDTLRVPRASLRFVPPPTAKIEERPRQNPGVSYVWIPTGDGGIKPIQVEIGTSGDEFTEIHGGTLSEGDRVIVEASVKASDDSGLSGFLPDPKRF